mmetsp:Transcript_32735/g.72312  ORF Transcript_32735/g.72312 Transcript_32735/m.72312 type:complete len:987 (-) Transcript_32735:326-3286(-)
MVKAYLRYEFAAAYGVITSNSNPVYDASGTQLLTSSLENISLWNLKQGSLVRTLQPSAPSTSTSSPAEVTILARSPQGPKVAAGYSDGCIRIWDTSSGECNVTFKGHKAAVTALRFNASGSHLASGSKDTDLIMWDVVGETGLYRLRGHKDQVTDLVFVDRAHKLVSCSKDGLVKVWDLDTQHCCQTIAGHKAEVWTLDVDPAQKRLVTGSTDHELRVYAIQAAGEEEEGEEAAAAAAGTSGPAGSAKQHDLLRAMGSVKRQAGGNERVVLVRYDEAGELLSCLGAGKTLELFRVRSEEEARKKLRRRKKRRREKQQKKQAGAADGSDGEDAAGKDAEDAAEEGDVVQASDELEPLHVVSCKHKIKSFAFAPRAAMKAAAAGAGGKRPKAGSGTGAAASGPLARLALSMANNSLDVVEVVSAQTGGGDAAVVSVSHEVAGRLELTGHRSDIRTLALSPDDQLLMSASNSAVKVWNPATGTCLATMESGYGLCCLFAPGSRHAVLGTKEGALEVFDLGAAERVHVEEAHSGAVWSLAALPDNTGFVSGSADKTVKFWQWSVVVGTGGSRQLRLSHTRTLKMADDVLCVRVSPDSRLLAVSLLDATIKVFYLDSLKFFLSLYGHKLPVLCMDISSDSTLLVSGSADKNIKVWGLDFGDCHKSLFAHSDTVMQVAFVRNTHYCFTVGKDRLLKYWDLDRHEMLLELPGHHGEVWALAVSSYGDFIVTGSHDRSLRRWERTQEPFFVEEEKEKRLESLFEADLDKQQAEGDAEGAAGARAQEEGGVAPAGRRTLDSVSAADAIIEALDIAANEADRIREHEAEKSKAAAAGGSSKAVKPLAPNPMMLGLNPSAYVLRAVSNVKAADMESALLMMPFSEALKLLGYLPQWLGSSGAKSKRGSTAHAHAELAVRVAVLLLRLHHAQLTSTSSARPVLLRLQRSLRPAVQGLKDVVGFNMAALQHLQRQARDRAAVVGEADPLLAAKKALLKA